MTYKQKNTTNKSNGNIRRFLNGIYDFVTMSALFASAYVLFFDNGKAMATLAIILFTKGLQIASQYFLTK